MSKHRIPQDHTGPGSGIGCVSCGQPVNDGYLCRTCADCGHGASEPCANREPRANCLAHTLADIAELADDLDVMLTRRDVLNEGSQQQGKPQKAKNVPLPWNDAASKEAAKMRAELVALVREQNPQPVRIGGPACRLCTHPSCAVYWRSTWPADTARTMALWLLEHVEDLRHDVTADVIYSAALRVARRARYVVDRRPDRWYAGPCNETHGDVKCTADLYADHNATEVRCRVCGAEHDIEERQEWLQKAAKDQLLHAEWIGRAMPTFGLDITPAAIRGYAHRGMIVQKGHDQQRRPLYRVGDVIDVARKAMERRAEAQSRRSA